MRWWTLRRRLLGGAVFSGSIAFTLWFCGGAPVEATMMLGFTIGLAALGLGWK